MPDVPLIWSRLSQDVGVASRTREAFASPGSALSLSLPATGDGGGYVGLEKDVPVPLESIRCSVSLRLPGPPVTPESLELVLFYVGLGGVTPAAGLGTSNYAFVWSLKGADIRLTELYGGPHDIPLATELAYDRWYRVTIDLDGRRRRLSFGVDGVSLVRDASVAFTNQAAGAKVVFQLATAEAGGARRVLFDDVVCDPR